MSQFTPEEEALLGRPVQVANPNTGDVWVGMGIALSKDPVVCIEQADGTRLMLPLAWASLI